MTARMQNEVSESESLPRHPQAPTPTLLSAPLWKVKVLITQSCLTLCNHMDCSAPYSSLHWILQARILERVAMPSSRGSSWPGIEPRSPGLQAGSLPSEKSSSLWFGFYYCSPLSSFLPFILSSFIKLSFYFVQYARCQYYYPQSLFTKKLLLLLEGWTNQQAVLGSIIIAWHRSREGEREGREKKGETVLCQSETHLCRLPSEVGQNWVTGSSQQTKPPGLRLPGLSFVLLCKVHVGTKKAMSGHCLLPPITSSAGHHFWLPSTLHILAWGDEAYISS